MHTSSTHAYKTQIHTIYNNQHKRFSSKRTTTTVKKTITYVESNYKNNLTQFQKFD